MLRSEKLELTRSPSLLGSLAAPPSEQNSNFLHALNFPTKLPSEALLASKATYLHHDTVPPAASASRLRFRLYII
jgi:hypothetical protein